VPDRTFLLVIDPKTSLARIRHRRELIPFERLAFLEKVYRNYLVVSKGKRFIHLDAIKPIDELVQLCCEEILR
jgi:thymidylate kinase